MFLRKNNISIKGSKINQTDLENAYKFFKFSFYKQAHILFDKLKMEKEANMYIYR